jgi:hypothetical protein
LSVSNRASFYKKALIILTTIVLSLLIYVGTVDGGFAYIYAIYLESKWAPAHPKTRVGLEKYLHLYSVRTIQPSQSQWGNHYNLADNERMVQYLILWSAPLDVVYDRNDNIVQIFTSYE